MAAAKGDARCAAALDVYIHTLCRNLAAVAASLDHVDAMVFTGGVGEHSQLVRSSACQRLAILALGKTPGHADGDTVLAAPGRRPAVVVVAAREDAQMARETRQLLGRLRPCG